MAYRMLCEIYTSKGPQITELKIDLDFYIFVPKMAISGIIAMTVTYMRSFNPRV